MNLFKARIFHKRFHPKVNEFLYRGFYIRFDLNQVEKLKMLFFSLNRFNLFSFYNRDHGNRDESDLRAWAINKLETAGINNFQGRIELQTFPRVLGHVFNPVSFWYCFEGNDKLKAVICEVNNTFGEGHNYVLNFSDANVPQRLPKRFHVSPFYPVSGEYLFDFSEENKVVIDYYDKDRLQLQTSIVGQPILLTNKTLLGTWIRYPFYSFMVLSLIHYQALKLFLKKCRFYTKPDKPAYEVTYGS